VRIRRAREKMIAMLKDQDGNVGWDVVFARLVNGETQEQIANTMGLSQSALSNLIRYARRKDPEVGQKWDDAKKEKAERIRDEIIPIIDNVVPKKADPENGIPAQDWRDAIMLVRERVQARVQRANTLDPPDQAPVVAINLGDALAKAIQSVAEKQKQLPPPEPMPAEIVPE
jgi:transcriptional regulator with XRE-family HTH domain